MVSKRMVGVIGCTLLWALTISAAGAKTPEEKALKVGKRGEITLTQPTMVGDKLLQPARYIIQHRDSGTDHFVRFVEVVLDPSPEGGRQPNEYAASDNVGEIKCRMEATSTKVLDTTAYVVTDHGAARITKVAIKGEDAVHIL